MLNLTDNWCDPTSLNITAKHNTFNTWDSAFVLIQVFHWKNIKIRLHPPPPGVQFSLPVPTNPGQNSSCWRYSWGSSQTVMFRMFVDILVAPCFSLPRSGNHSPHNSPSPCSMSIWSPRWETSARNSINFIIFISIFLGCIYYCATVLGTRLPQINEMLPQYYSRPPRTFGLYRSPWPNWNSDWRSHL